MRALDYLTSRLGSVTANTRRKAIETLTAAQSAGHDPVFMWGYDPNVFNPEHHSGRALDFMVGLSTLSDKSKAAGDFIAEHLWANRARYGVRHIIWRQRVRSTVIEPGVWRAMADRGNTTANHFDHVHVWFLDDRYAKADPTPKPKPKPAPKPKQIPGPRYAFPLPAGYYFGVDDGTKFSVSGKYGRSFKGHPDAWWIKEFFTQLERRGWDVRTQWLKTYGNDGRVGGDEVALIRAFQKDQRLKDIDGRIGPKTWTAAFFNPVTPT